MRTASARCALVLGALLLLASLRLPWFLVPVSGATWAGAAGQGADTAITDVEPAATGLFRMASALGATLALVLALRPRRPARTEAPERLASRVAAVLFVLLLFFPHSVMVQDPASGGRAAWLHAQTTDLTWLGGDVATSQGERESVHAWRVLLPDLRTEVRVLPLPGGPSGVAGLQRLPDVAEWLGYSPAFGAFVQPGWPLAIVGTLILLAGSIRVTRYRRLHLSTRVLRFGGSVLVLATAAVLFAPLRAGAEMTRGREEAARGAYAEAAGALERAARILPALGQDGHFVRQVGLLDRRRGRDASLEARLHRAVERERMGLVDESRQEHVELLDDAGPTSPVRRDAARALVRLAIHDLNTGRTARAAHTLERVVAVEPCHIKANYALQVACLRLGDRARLERLVRTMARVLEPYGPVHKAALLDLCRTHVRMAAVAAGDFEQVLRLSSTRAAL